MEPVLVNRRWLREVPLPNALFTHLDLRRILKVFSSSSARPRRRIRCLEEEGNSMVFASSGGEVRGSDGTPAAARLSSGRPPSLLDGVLPLVFAQMVETPGYNINAESDLLLHNLELESPAESHN